MKQLHMKKGKGTAKMHVFEEQILISRTNINHERNDCNSVFSCDKTIKCFTRLKEIQGILLCFGNDLHAKRCQSPAKQHN